MRKFLLPFLFLFLFVPTAQAQSTDSRFGVIEAYEAPEMATELGVGWTRVRFPWAEVQPDSPDQWLEVHGTDAQISAEINQNREVIGLLIGIPSWARDEVDLPLGLYLDHKDPNNLWATYVRQAVSRYDGQINHWIIWNEPDIWDENALGYTWHGDEADFAQLMRVAYLTAKETSPDIVIHLSAMTFFWDNNFGRIQYLDRLLDELVADDQAAANNYYFDIATAHLYFQPNQIFDILSLWQGIMAEHGLEDKPWWLIETNAPVSDDPSWPVDSVTLAVSQADQANFIPQAFSVALAAGMDRIGIFKLIDTDSDKLANPEPFGLLRNDGSPRPAFLAYQQAIQLMSDVTFSVRERWDSVGQVRLQHLDGSQTHVLFARVGETQQVKIGALAETAQLITLNDQTTLFAEDGEFLVELAGSPCTQPIADHCMIGGETVYLVQNVASDSSGNQAEQAQTDTPTPIVPTLAPTAEPVAQAATEAPPEEEPEATPTPAETPTPRPTPRPRPQEPTTTQYILTSCAVMLIGILMIAGFIISRK